MKVESLFPRMQLRAVQTNRSSREAKAAKEPRAGVTVELRSKAVQASDLNRDEAFILLGRTMAQLD